MIEKLVLIAEVHAINALLASALHEHRVGGPTEPFGQIYLYCAFWRLLLLEAPSSGHVRSVRGHKSGTYTINPKPVNVLKSVIMKWIDEIVMDT